MRKTSQAIGPQPAVQPAAQRQGANSAADAGIIQSPRMTAQRKQLSEAFGSAAQLAAEKKKPMQKKTDEQTATQFAGIKKKPGEK